MMAAAATIFGYYTTWAILVVRVSLAYSKNAALTPKLYSHSSMPRAPYTRGSLHGNGQCAFPLSFWSLVYLPSGHLLGQLLLEKTRRRRRKPRVGLRDA